MLVGVPRQIDHMKHGGSVVPDQSCAREQRTARAAVAAACFRPPQRFFVTAIRGFYRRLVEGTGSKPRRREKHVEQWISVEASA